MKTKVKCVSCQEEFEIEEYQLVNNGKNFECLNFYFLKIFIG